MKNQKGKIMKTILFQGDSITDANRNRESTPVENIFPTSWFGTGYVAMTAARLLLDHPQEYLQVINRGISGNRVVDLYARWKVDALNFRPDIISILIGVNDVWHEYSDKNGVEPERFEQVYDMLLDWTGKVLPETKIIIGQPFCLHTNLVTEDFYNDVQVLGKITEKLAVKHKTLFIPYQKLFNDAVKNRENRYYLADGVHPGIAGAELMARALTPAIESCL